MEIPARHPGPKGRAMLEDLRRYVIADPFPFGVDLARSHGPFLATVDGPEVFDWTGMYGSRLLGYNHPRLQAPEYLARLAAAANAKAANPDFLTPECLDYYRLLHALAPRCMRGPTLEVYALNSGAEAVENMMKYLIHLFDRKQEAKGKQVGNRRFIYFDQAFHGRTVFALNVTQLGHDPVITKDFHGFVPGNLKLAFPAFEPGAPAEQNRRRLEKSLDQCEALLEQLADEVVGIIVEPIQGAGGHRVAQAEFFRGLSELAHRFGVYLGFDEVQTAGGQTGAFWAVDLFDLPHPPQAVAAAKKMANGVVYMLQPMTDEGVLDSTWGGSTADMVRFVEEMKIVRDEGLIESVPARADYLGAGLDALLARWPQLAHHRRGLGLYQGFSMRQKGHKGLLCELALQTEDVLLLGASTDSIRLRPVLDITTAHIDELLARLERCFARLAAA